MSLLKNENIVEYYGCANDGTYLSIFLEYAGGIYIIIYIGGSIA